MQRSRLGAIALGTSALLGAALASPALAATDSEIPTFTEFHASTYQDTDRQFIVNGDEPISTTGDLKSYYDRMVGGAEKAIDNGLVVNTVGGADDVWSTAQVGDLTYCVSTKFGARYTDVVNAMTSGAGLWEAASSRIDFVHVPSQVAPIARASSAAGSPQVGMPSKPTCTSSRPTRESSATPFHWLSPATAIS